MLKGIQYDLVSGDITGCCTPSIDLSVQPMPDGRGQLEVDPSLDYTGMKVDIMQNPPVLVPA